MYNKTGNQPTLLLNERKIPLVFCPLYKAFLQIKRQCTKTILFKDIIDYQQLYTIELLTIEIDWILHLDSIYNNIVNQRK